MATETVWLLLNFLQKIPLNTPEIKGATKTAGLASKKFVEDLLLNKEVCILTKKDTKEKYGRFLAWVYYQEAENLWTCINKKLVELFCYQ